MKHEIDKITAMILQLIEQDSELKEQFDLLQTVPGIGKITAVTLLVDCPELGEISAVKVSALAGDQVCGQSCFWRRWRYHG